MARESGKKVAMKNTPRVVNPQPEMADRKEERMVTLESLIYSVARHHIKFNECMRRAAMYEAEAERIKAGYKRHDAPRRAYA